MGAAVKFVEQFKALSEDADGFTKQDAKKLADDFGLKEKLKPRDYDLFLNLSSDPRYLQKDAQGRLVNGDVATLLNQISKRVSPPKGATLRFYEPLRKEPLRQVPKPDLDSLLIQPNKQMYAPKQAYIELHTQWKPNYRSSVIDGLEQGLKSLFSPLADFWMNLWD